jgi:hypothetical protein
MDVDIETDKTVRDTDTLVQRRDIAVLIAALEAPRRCLMGLQCDPTHSFAQRSVCVCEL